MASGHRGVPSTCNFAGKCFLIYTSNILTPYNSTTIHNGTGYCNIYNSVGWDIMRHLVLKLNITPERTGQNA